MGLLTQRMKEVDRKTLVADTAKLIDEEMAAKSGLTALPLKGGYKVVKAIKPGFIEESVDHLLDDCTRFATNWYVSSSF